MNTGLRAVATTPFIVHFLAGLGVLYDWGSLAAQKDSVDWWTAISVNCFRLGPGEGSLKVPLAVLQITAALVVLATQIPSALSVRRVGYVLLLAMYASIQTRHVVNGQGPEAIGFLFAHIFIYAVLVLHYERTCSASRLLESEKRE